MPADQPSKTSRPPSDLRKKHFCAPQCADKRLWPLSRKKRGPCHPVLQTWNGMGAQHRETGAAEATRHKASNVASFYQHVYQLQTSSVQCVQSSSSAHVRAQSTGESAINLSEFLQSFCQQPRKLQEIFWLVRTRSRSKETALTKAAHAAPAAPYTLTSAKIACIWSSISEGCPQQRAGVGFTVSASIS